MDANETNGHAGKPSYDKGSRILSVDGFVLRQFLRDAKNQIRVVEAFELAGWPMDGIENPFARPEPHDPERQLLDAVGELNSHQTQKLIHFWVEKGKQRVHWKFTDGDSGQPSGNTAFREK